MNRTDKAKSQQTSSLLRESAQILAATEQERLALENKLKKTAKELYAIHDELYACNAQREKESTIANFEIQRLIQINKTQEQKEIALRQQLAQNEENISQLTALLDDKDALLLQLENDLAAANLTISEQKKALEQKPKEPRTPTLKSFGRSPSPSPMKRKQSQPVLAEAKITDNTEKWQSELASKDALIASLQTELASIQESVASLEEALAQTKEGQDAAEERVWQLTNELQESLLKLEESKQFCAALETNGNLKDSLAERDLMDMELLIGSNKGNLKIIEQLKAECKALLTQNAELRHSSQQRGQENTAHEQEIDELKRTVETWQRQYTTAEARSKDLQEQLEKIHLMVQSELDTMQGDSEAAARTAVETVKQKAAEEKESLLQQLSQSSRDNQGLTESITAVNRDLSEANQSIALLDVRVESLRQEIGQLQEEVASRDREIVNLQKEFFELKSELDTKQQEVDEQRRMCAVAADAMHQTSNNMLALTAEKEALSSELEHRTSEAGHLKEEVEQLQGELTTLKSEMQQVGRSASDLITSLRSELSESAERVVQLEDELQHVADSYEKLDSEKRHSEQVLQSASQALQTQLDALLSVNQQLQKQFEDAVVASELLQGEMSVLNQDILRLHEEKDRLIQLEQATQDALKRKLLEAETALNEQVEANALLVTENVTLRSDCEAKTAAVTEAIGVQAELYIQIAALSEEKTLLESKLASRDESIAELKGRSDEVSALLSDVEAAIQNKDAQIKYLEAQYEALCGKNDEMTSAFESTSAQLVAAQAELQSIQDKTEQEKQDKLAESHRRRELRTYQDRAVVSTDKKDLASSFDNETVIPLYAVVDFEPLTFTQEAIAASAAAASSGKSGGSNSRNGSAHSLTSTSSNSKLLLSPTKKKSMIKVTNCGTALGYVARNEAALNSLSNPESPENVIKSLRSECASLKEQLTGSNDRLSSLETQLAVTLAEVSNLTHQRDSVLKEVDEQRGVNDTLTSQIEELEKRLQSLEADDIVQTAKVFSLEETLKQRSAEIEMLNAKIDEKELKIDEFTSEIAHLIEEVSNRNNDYEVACDEIQQLDDALAEALQRVEQFERVKESFEGTVVELTQKLSDLSQCNEQLTEELHGKTLQLEESSTAQQTVEKLERSLEKSTAELKEMNQRHDTLSEELQSVRSECQLEVDVLTEEKEALTIDLLGKQHLIDGLQQEAADLRGQLDRALKQIDSLQSDLSDCYSECKLMHDKESALSDAQSKHQAEVERLNQSLRDLQQRLAGYQEDNEQLRTTANKLQGQVVNETKSFSAEILDHMNKATRLSQELAAKTAENASFQETVVILDATVDEQKASLSQCAKRIAELEQIMLDKESELAFTQKEQSALQSQLDRLTVELETVVCTLKEKESLMHQQLLESQSHKQLIATLQAEADEAHSKHREEGAKHTQQKEISSSVITTLKEMNSTLRTEIDAMTQSVTDKNIWLEQMKQEQQDTTNSIALLETKLAEMRAEAAEKSRRIDELNRQLQSAESDCESWKGRWEAVSADLKEKSDALIQSDACIRSSHVESAMLKQQCDETRGALESAQKQVLQQEQTQESMQKRIDEMEALLKEYDTTADKLSSDLAAAADVVTSLRSEVTLKSETILQLSQKVNAGELDLYAKQRQLDDVSGALQDKEAELARAEKSLRAAEDATAAEKLTASQQKDVFSGIIASFKEKNAALTEEKVSLSTQLKNAQLAESSASEEMDTLRAQSVVGKERVKELEDEIVALSTQLNDSKGVSAVSTDEKVTLSEQLNNAQMEVDSLRSQNATLSERIKQLDDRVAALQAELDEANTHLVDETVLLSENLLESQMEASASKAELDLYRVQSFVWNNGTKEFEARIAALEAELVDAKNAAAGLSQELVDAQKATTAAKVECNSVTAQNTSLNTRVTELEQQIVGLSEEVALSRNAADENTQSSKLIESFNKDREAWQKQLSELQAELTAVAVLEVTLSMITQERDDALKDVQSLESQLSEMQAEVDSLKVSAENTFDLVMSTDELSQSNADLSAELSQLKQELSERDNDLQSMTELYNSLSQKCSELTASLASAKGQLEEINDERAADFETLQQLRVKASEDQLKLNHLLKEEDKWKQARDVSNNIIKSVQDKNVQLQMEVKELHKQLEEETNSLEDMVLAKNEVDVELNKVSEKLARMEKEAKTSAAALNEATNKIHSLESMLKMKESLHSQVVSESLELDTKLTEKTAELVAITQLYEELKLQRQQAIHSAVESPDNSNIDKLMQDLTEATVKIQKLESDRLEATEKLGDKNAALVEKDNQLAQMKLELNSALLSAEHLTMELASYKAINSELVDDSEKHGKCVELLNTTLKELQEKHNRTTEQLREAFESLAGVRKEKDELSAEKEKLLRGKEVSGKLIQTLKADVEKLKIELASACASAATSAPASVSATELGAANLSLYTLQKDYDELLSNYQANKAALNAKIVELEGELERSHEECESLREQLPLIPKSKTKAPSSSAKLSSSSSDSVESIALQQSLESMKLDQRNALKMIRKMESQISAYAAELEAKIGEAQQSKSACHLLQIDVGLLRQAKTELEARVAHLEEVLKFEREASQGLQAQELSDALKHSERQAQIIDELKASLAEITAVSEELRKQKEISDRGIVRLREELADLQDALDVRDEAVADMTADVQRAAEKLVLHSLVEKRLELLKGSNQALETKLAEREAELAALLAEKAEVEEKLQQSALISEASPVGVTTPLSGKLPGGSNNKRRNSKDAAELAALNQQLSLLRAEKQQTQEVWTKLLSEKDGSIASLQTESAVLIATLNTQRASHQEVASANEALKQTNEELHAQITALMLVQQASAGELEALQKQLQKESERFAKQKDVSQQLVTSLKDKHAALLAEKTQLETDVLKKAQEFQAQAYELAAMKVVCESLQKNKDTYEEKANRALAELDEARAALAAATAAKAETDTAVASDNDSSKDAAVVIELQERVDQLQTQLEAMEKVKRESMMQVFDSLNKLEAAQTAKKQLEEQLAIQHKDIQFLNVMYERTRTEMSKTAAEVQEKSQQIEDLLQRVNEATSQLAAKDASLATLDKCLSEKSKQCETAENQVEELKVQLKSLQQQLSGMQQQLADSWNADMGSKESMNALQQSKCELEQTLAKEIEKATKQKEVMSGVIKTLKEENTALKTQDLSRQSEVEEQAIRVMQLEAILQSQDGELATLRSHAKVSSADYQSLVESRDDLIAQKQQLDGIIADLHRQVAELQKSNDVSLKDASDSKTQLEQLLESYDVVLSQKKELDGLVTELEVQVNFLTEGNVVLSNNLAASTAECQSLLATKDDLSSDNDRLNASLASLQKQFATLQSSHNSLTDEVTSLTKSLESKSQQIKKLLSEKESDKQAASKAQVRASDIESELVMLRSQLSNLESAKASLQEQVDKLVSENGDLHCQITALLLVQESHDQTVAGVNSQKQAEIDKLQKHKEITAGLVNTLREKNTSLEQQMSDLLVEYDAKNKEHLVLNEAVKLLQHELLSFRLERDHLENSLELAASLLEEKDAHNSLLLAESVALNALVDPAASAQTGQQQQQQQLRVDLDAERDKLAKYKESSNVIIEGLKDTIAKQDTLFHALNAESELVTSKLTETEDILSALRMKHDQVLAEKEAELLKLQEELQVATKSCEEQQAALKVENEAVAGLNKSLSVNQEALADANAEIQTLQKEIDQLHHTLSTNTANKAHQDDVIVRLRSEKDQLQSQCSELQNKLNDVESELHHLSAKYADLLAERDMVQQSLLTPNRAHNKDDSGLDYSNIYQVNDADQLTVQSSCAQFGEMVRHPSFKKAESCYIDMSEIYGDNADDDDEEVGESESGMDDTLRLSRSMTNDESDVGESFAMMENELRISKKDGTRANNQKRLEKKESCYVDMSQVYDDDDTEEVIAEPVNESNDDFVYYSKGAAARREEGAVPMMENRLRQKKGTTAASAPGTSDSLRPYSMTDNELRMTKKERQELLERKESCFVDMSTVYDDDDDYAEGDEDREFDNEGLTISADTIPMMENELRLSARSKKEGGSAASDARKTLLKRESDLIDMSGIYSVGEDEMLVQGVDGLVAMRLATNDLTPIKSTTANGGATVSTANPMRTMKTAKAAAVPTPLTTRKVMHYTTGKQSSVDTTAVSSLSDFTEASDGDNKENCTIQFSTVEIETTNTTIASGNVRDTMSPAEEKRKQNKRPSLKRSFHMKSEDIARATALGRLLMNDLVRIDFSTELSHLSLLSCVSARGEMSCLSSLDANDAAEMEMSMLAARTQSGSPSFMMLNNSSSSAADEGLGGVPSERCASPSGASVASAESASSARGSASSRSGRRHSRSMSTDSASSAGSSKSHRRRRRESSSNLTPALLPNALRNLQRLTVEAVMEHHIHKDPSGRIVSDLPLQHDYELEASDVEGDLVKSTARKPQLSLHIPQPASEETVLSPPPLKHSSSSSSSSGVGAGGGGSTPGIAFVEDDDGATSSSSGKRVVLVVPSTDADDERQAESEPERPEQLTSPVCQGAEDLKADSADSGDESIWGAHIAPIDEFGLGSGDVLPSQLLKTANTPRRPSKVHSLPRDIFPITEGEEDVFSE